MPSGCVSPSRTSSGVETSIVADAGSEAVLSALSKPCRRPRAAAAACSARARSKEVAKLKLFFGSRRSHVPRSSIFFHA